MHADSPKNERFVSKSNRTSGFVNRGPDKMTTAQRNAEILRILQVQTKRNTVSKAAARASLIAEGIYTKKGKLRVAFGGSSTRKAPAAAD